jgi:hypothetical protein
MQFLQSFISTLGLSGGLLRHLGVVDLDGLGEGLEGPVPLTSKPLEP